MSAAWHTKVKAGLAALDPGECDPETLAFFRNHYQPNIPTVVDLASWPAMNWNLDSIGATVGLQTPVEVQTDREDDPDYEMRSYSHKSIVPFGWFADSVRNGRGNDVYMTAQNQSINSIALEPLWEDVGALPGFLRPNPSEGFVWIGRDTVTPLHHDETNNVMAQVMGTKLVRMFAPDERAKLSPSVGVHSNLGWVTDQMIADLELNVVDVWLRPGKALFLPIGWWHTVKAFGLATTLVYTNFIWPNFWGRTTD